MMPRPWRRTDPGRGAPGEADRRTPTSGLTGAGVLLLVMLSGLALPGFPTPGRGTLQAQTRDATQCRLCHGEIELLRQQTASMDEARRLYAPAAHLLSSAHGDMTCAECHTSFDVYPHPERRTRIATCASCHEEAEAPWSEGAHHDPDDGASCAQCHGVHDVQSVADLNEADGIRDMNDACVDCHATQALPVMDPHADTVSCAGCHAPHRTLTVEDPDAMIAAANQAATCGACHEEPGREAPEDSHGDALSELPEVNTLGLPDHRALGADAPPTCTSCHGEHGMAARSQARFSQEMVDGCASCHSDYADSYYGTYHGKATALGSEIVATCDQCHGSHQIYPADDERSAVAPANLTATCGECHEHVRPAFTEYDSHPDPMDRSRNAPLFYSFVFMNALLLGVLVVFGLHTALWWLRLVLDKRRGIHHGIGGDHG